MKLEEADRISMEDFIERTVDRKVMIIIESAGKNNFRFTFYDVFLYCDRIKMGIEDTDMFWELSDDFYYFNNNGVFVCKNGEWHLTVV